MNRCLFNVIENYLFAQLCIFTGEKKDASLYWLFLNELLMMDADYER